MAGLPTERAEEIFYSALEIEPPAQREAYVDHACRQDADLRMLVDKLLASQAGAVKTFPEGGVARIPLDHISRVLGETPGLVENADSLANHDEFIGSYVGAYKLLQKIGEGGCGTVYMAEQERPVRRKAALKVIKLGMDTKSVITRFEAERQALAMMDHPNIARVLDAGATETGRPYFVMELVRGIKITEYCDQNKLDTWERLSLFIQICHAIQHAHQKGVIHRDIKPSNILITIIDGKPVPKVIDFGIAKAIEGRLADDTMFTPYEHFIGTPAYMSPEQAVMSGVDVDTRSDIYSLGVLLYELMTGRTPFETKELLESGLDGLRRTLLEREPKRPSAIVTTMEGTTQAQIAQQRQSEPVKLISLLQGDLDWIVIRCLEKDRARRYQTANGLALEIERYLHNEPIIARPPSRFYRLQKLIRRNKVTFVAGTVVALTLIVGLGVSTWFWYQERDARKRAVESQQRAEKAEQQQMQLRMEAEDRERITQAAFLISQNKFQEADDLVSRVLAVQPSLETESVLRTLGEWHALKGQWTQAAQCYQLLLEADQKDDSWAITDDLMKAGPILVERGDMAGYDKFRRVATSRYSGTKDPIFAERTLKVCLLTPANPELMKKLELFSDLAVESLQRSDSLKDFWEAWRCISIALMAYRQNYTPTAIDWCQKCLSFKDGNLCRYATAHVIEAVAYYKLGETDKANSQLALGRDLINSNFAKGLSPGSGMMGFWYDWLFARILLREADSMMGISSEK